MVNCHIASGWECNTCVCKISSLEHIFSDLIGPVDKVDYVVLPTALKGCWGIVFTHGVRTGGWAVDGQKFVQAVSQNP